MTLRRYEEIDKNKQEANKQVGYTVSHLARPSDKLQEQCLFFFCETPQHRPQMINLRVTGLVSVVFCVRTQVVDVHIRQAADQQLQLLRVEQANKIRRHQFVKPLQECVDLKIKKVVMDVN